MGISLSKVSYSYNPKDKKNLRYVLKDISLNIDSNDEMIAIVGHTGSGKSTLVQLMNGLLLSKTGEVKVFDTLINKKTKLKNIRKNIGLVFQFPEYQIFEETVLKDIMFGPKNFNDSDPEKSARKIAEVMKITPLLERSPFTLSGGQMRKVAIAGILASDPKILILDEPTVGLDPLAKKELLEFLTDLNKQYHKTIIIITHDMEVVAKYIKRVIVLKEGQVMYDGSKHDLFTHEDIIQQCNLDYPEIVKILKKIKDKFNVDLDIYQYNIYDAKEELKKFFGGHNE